MKAEVISVGENAQRWADAVLRDRDAGLLPSWIGAVIVSANADGTAALTFVKKSVWIAARMRQLAEDN